MNKLLRFNAFQEAKHFIGIKRWDPILAGAGCGGFLSGNKVDLLKAAL